MVMLYKELLSRATNDVIVELREYCLRLLAQLNRPSLARLPAPAEVQTLHTPDRLQKALPTRLVLLRPRPVLPTRHALLSHPPQPLLLQNGVALRLGEHEEVHRVRAVGVVLLVVEGTEETEVHGLLV